MHNIFFFTAFALPLLTFAAPTTYPRSSIRRLPRQSTNITSPPCDLSTLRQPPNTLPPPSSDETLLLVALGLGTQNYTCTSATTPPTQIGAVATLYDASCTLASSGSENAQNSIYETTDPIGTHYFTDSTTPVFDIQALGGNTVVKRADSMTAPGAQGKNVPWLLLARTEASESKARKVYRVETVGGVAPASCEGVEAGTVLTVGYEAQYWFYG
ncbi:hypothetical protein M011DRAFT_399541 [Sporormia fimetaria CBS 119925]|uniref:Malate dehydrogenase n=1 Tax=Sporormia fimetaria CBS 119925 TaxID=1340428 RepID=A0A6A6VGK9_9PLEO|nr:hypothetical protein M011DRAFT_399541 [Sporormia fimetaria CBS 119925]